jgi:hypothetical protein
LQLANCRLKRAESALKRFASAVKLLLMVRSHLPQGNIPAPAFSGGDE